MEPTFERGRRREVPHEFSRSVAGPGATSLPTAMAPTGYCLVGDAAHLNNPSGGFGLNTGLGDAVDLGWKLAAALDRLGRARLLASYPVERRGSPCATCARPPEPRRRPPPRLPSRDQGRHPGGAGRAKEMGEDIVARQTNSSSPTAPRSVTATRRRPRAGRRHPGAARHERDYSPTARPGSARRIWLADGRSIIDLYGRGFAYCAWAGRPDCAPSSGAFPPGRDATVRAARPRARTPHERVSSWYGPMGMSPGGTMRRRHDPQALADRVRGAVAT